MILCTNAHSNSFYCSHCGLSVCNGQGFLLEYFILLIQTRSKGHLFLKKQTSNTVLYCKLLVLTIVSFVIVLVLVLVTFKIIVSHIYRLIFDW